MSLDSPPKVIQAISMAAAASFSAEVASQLPNSHRRSSHGQPAATDVQRARSWGQHAAPGEPLMTSEGLRAIALAERAGLGWHSGLLPRMSEALAARSRGRILGEPYETERDQAFAKARMGVAGEISNPMIPVQRMDLRTQRQGSVILAAGRGQAQAHDGARRNGEQGAGQEGTGRMREGLSSTSQVQINPPGTWTASSGCATVEEMGEMVATSTAASTSQLRQKIRSHLAVYGTPGCWKHMGTAADCQSQRFWLLVAAGSGRR